MSNTYNSTIKTHSIDDVMKDFQSLRTSTSLTARNTRSIDSISPAEYRKHVVSLEMQKRAQEKELEKFIKGSVHCVHAISQISNDLRDIETAYISGNSFRKTPKPDLSNTHNELENVCSASSKTNKQSMWVKIKGSFTKCFNTNKT